MNVLHLTTRFYGHLKLKKAPFWLLTPVRRCIRKFANFYLPRYLQKSNSSTTITKKNLVVSITSFPARINDVWKVVECIKRQSVLPEKIILWLSLDQFPQKENLPMSLLRLEDDLFSIRMVEGDLRSHKKYFYILKEYPEKNFITIDDDVFYDPNMIKRLLDTSMLFPGCVIANHTSHINISDDSVLQPYSTWGDDEPMYADEDRIQIGVGGVYYPQGVLHPLVLNHEVFMNTTPMADDIWLNCMARLANVKVVQSSEALIPLSIENKSPNLCAVNTGAMHMNDVQIDNLRKYLVANGYPDVYTKKL